MCARYRWGFETRHYIRRFRDIKEGLAAALSGLRDAGVDAAIDTDVEIGPRWSEFPSGTFAPSSRGLTILIRDLNGSILCFFSLRTLASPIFFYRGIL